MSHIYYRTKDGEVEGCEFQDTLGYIVKRL